MKTPAASRPSVTRTTAIPLAEALVGVAVSGTVAELDSDEVPTRLVRHDSGFAVVVLVSCHHPARRRSQVNGSLHQQGDKRDVCRPTRTGLAEASGRVAPCALRAA